MPRPRPGPINSEPLGWGLCCETFFNPRVMRLCSRAWEPPPLPRATAVKSRSIISVSRFPDQSSSPTFGWFLFRKSGLLGLPFLVPVPLPLPSLPGITSGGKATDPG